MRLSKLTKPWLFWRWLDRLTYHHKFISIGLLLGVIASIFLLLVICSRHLEGKTILYLFSIFTQNTLPGDDALKDDIFFLITSTFGAIFFSGFLIATITNALIGRRVEYKDGKTRYKLANHTVIFGANSQLEAVLDYLSKKEEKNKGERFNDYIVIVTSADPNSIRNRIHKYAYINDHTEIYNAVLDDEKLIEELYLSKANKVYILGDVEPKHCDVQNARLTFEVIKSLSSNDLTGRDCTHKGISCDVLYFNFELISAALSQVKNPEVNFTIPPYVSIRLFNYLEGCLSFHWGGRCTNLLFNSGTTDYQHSLIPADGKGYHFVVIGSGDLARTCIRKIISLAHFGKEAKTIVTIVCNDRLQAIRYLATLGIKDGKTLANIIFDFKEEDDIPKKGCEGKTLYYVIATGDADKDSIWMSYLSENKSANLLGYAEDFEEEIQWRTNQFAENPERVAYWGYNKLCTHIKLEEGECEHAQYLHRAFHNIQDNKMQSSFANLTPMQQMAWRDFYNYVYYLIYISGHKLSRRSHKELEKDKEKAIAKSNTISALSQDRVVTAVKQYQHANTIMHHGDALAAKEYKEQLNNICDNYKEIIANYLTSATHRDNNNVIHDIILELVE